MAESPEAAEAEEAADASFDAMRAFLLAQFDPLTGVTFPFVSMGGSSMISCWGLMAYLKAADTRQNASFALRFVAPAPKKSAAPRPKVKQEGFFADRPDIPVDEIFKKENRK